MTDHEEIIFILGVLSLPAAILAALVGWVALKALTLAGDRLAVGALMRLTPASKKAERAATASVIYGCRRSFMWAPGNFALIVAAGFDHDEIKAAAGKLRPEVSLREMGLPEPIRARNLGGSE